MKLEKLKQYVKVYYDLVGFVWLTIFIGCISEPKSSNKDITTVTFDTIALIKQFDKFFYYADSTNQLKYKDSAASVFNNVQLAIGHPDLVRRMYDIVLQSQQGYLYKKDSSKTIENILYQFNQLTNKLNNESLSAWNRYFLARFYNNNQQNEIALPMLLNSYQEFVGQNDTNGISITTKRIGIIYHDSYKDYHKAAEYLQRALRLATALPEISAISSRLTLIYLELGQLDSACMSLKNVNQQNHFLEVNLLYQAYLFTNTANGSMDSVKASLRSLDEFYSLRISDYTKSIILSAMAKLSLALMKQNDVKAALEYINLGLKYDSICQFCLEEKVELYRARYVYFQHLNDFANAFKYLIEFNEAVNKLNFERRKASVEEARVRYEFERQQDGEKIKQENALEINKQAIQKQKIIRNSFIAGSILLLLLIVVLINRAKLKRTVEMERMRNRLSRDLHDDIGSTLSSINILSRTAQNNLSQADDKTKATLEKINERSQRLLDNMKDIIWNINPENDTIEEVMSRMREYATAILEAKYIDYTFNFPNEKIDCILSMEVKNNMYLIFKEAVNNLSKYSGATKAHISLTFDEKNIHLKIEDNGKGFNDDEIPHKGGLQNMKIRAEEISGIIMIDSKIETGTVIELSVPLYL